MTYFEALCAAMETLAQDPRVVFLGQAVACGGTAMSRTLEKIPVERRLETPVIEDMQMGMAIGMSLHGLIPVCVYPRWNFLLLAANQLVLHLDKLPTYSRGGYRPRVIVRTAVANDSPLNPGVQHLGDFTDAFRSILSTVRVHRLNNAYDVRERYAQAMDYEGSTLLVEDARRY